MSEMLTCWDYVKMGFTGQQAALAIVGEPNTEEQAARKKAALTLSLLRKCYEGTRRWFADMPEDASATPKALLVSMSMQAKQDSDTGSSIAGVTNVQFQVWLRSPVADFELQTFSREVLARWLKEAECPSMYQFADAVGQAADGVRGKVWTPERLAKLKAYRKEHGTKKTAEHFQVSEAHIRKLLPGDKPQPKGYSAFTHRTK